ncbi:pyruvate carboxylase [Anaerofustis sp.]|uniref:pyruvate carboxylase n=1 Tax=Anaerofustis sp. TaxID=1872517 RepID=UPI0025BBFD67|nr:pyruvate carboxylase [Anaerofustis sp.]
MRKFKRVLIANRGEIAIRIIRAVQELGMKAICIYCEEDKLSLFRNKADEAYLIKGTNSPTDAYLNIEAIIELAKAKNIDAIHPGYGFLSENPIFAAECEKAGIKFIGPNSKVIELLGNKVNAKNAAIEAGVSVLDGVKVDNVEEAKEISGKIGYPVIIKASAGGGGRGMRVCEREEDLKGQFESAVREAKKAFNNGEVFIEKYVRSPRHVEAQILADEYGHIVHLYERDCSIQRRHQKIIEFSPSQSITEETRKAICEESVNLAKHVGYTNAGTVEFLVDENEKHYFMEVNPRIQVEHTVTELVTNVDLVQAQILIAQGYKLSDSEINIKSQDDIKMSGAAIECRVTTENVLNNFMPDTGKISVYKTGAGPGVRLDGGNGFAGSEITPYFDSLLVKTTTYARDFDKARKKMIRTLKEHEIEGVSTNKDFLINVLEHPDFKKGICNTNFIEDHPELFNIKEFDNKLANILTYISEVTLKNGSKDKEIIPKIEVPIYKDVPKLTGTKQILDEKGPEGLVQWIKDEKQLLFMDTTMRDAQQSLFATRMRTNDFLKIAESVSRYEKDVYALELWGGATFDTSYRFLKESPWSRLELLREMIPNILFQMLLRGSNAVGYKNYPDNVIKAFIKQSAKSGVDIFRIFDSLNWLDQIKPSVEEVLKLGKVAEVAICYTGDILDKTKTKYTLDYYVKKAKEVEAMGAHILAIKDMSGLLKPAAAMRLVKALKDEVKMPIHFHTHDTAGNGVSSMLMASAAGVDIVSGAVSLMSGTTSQPSLDSIAAALENTPRESKINLDEIQIVNDYYEKVRKYYTGFESGLKTGTTQIYKYEVPGGQYSNLKSQVESFGLGHRFTDVLDKYKQANELLGDIIKVTPTSKVVGDFAIFMLQNDLDKENIYEKGKDLAFPDSVVDFFKGMIGQPEWGFDEKLREVVLKGADFITERPGLLLPDEDFDKIRKEFKEEFNMDLNDKQVLSAALYPKVYKDYLKFKETYGDLTYMPTDAFFTGLAKGEETEVFFGEGKSHVIKLVRIGNTHPDGKRRMVYEVDGFRRALYITDPNFVINQTTDQVVEMANPKNEKHIGSPIPGSVIKVNVAIGEEVKKNQAVCVVEAMKMETEVVCPCDGVIKDVLVQELDSVKAGQLLIELE